MSDRAALVAAGILHVVLVVSVAVQPLDGQVPASSWRFPTAPLHFDAVTWPGPGADFFALYHAGVQVRRGESPYDMTEHPRVTPYYFRYIYSPLLAETVGRVLSLLAPRAAYLAWLLVVETLLVACLWLFRAMTPAANVRTWGTALLLVSQPYIVELHMGQFTFAATALVILAAVLAQHATAMSSRIAAALFVSLAGLIKSFPFVSLPAFLRARGGRTAAFAAALSGLAIVVWSTVIRRDSSNFAAVTFRDDIGGPHPGSYSLAQAVYLLFEVFAGRWLPVLWPALPIAVVAAVLLPTIWRVVRSPRNDVLLGSVGTVAGVLPGVPARMGASLQRRAAGRGLSAGRAGRERLAS